MDPSPSSSASSSFVPPRRGVLSACLLAVLLLSSPTPASADSLSLSPSPTPPPSFLVPPAQTTPPPLRIGSTEILLGFAELDWPSSEERSARELNNPADPPPPDHIPPPRRQAGQSTTRRLRRQETAADQDNSTVTAGAEPSASEVVVADPISEVLPQTGGGPLAVASTTISDAPAAATSTASEAATSTQQAMGKAAPPVPTPNLPVRNPFPQPFDLTLNLNLSSTCLDYFAYFLSTPTFKACRPFSFLQSSSSAFSSIMSQSNLTDITGVIQATLDVGDAGECEATMVGLGTTLKDRCKADLAVGVPIVKEAMTGFQTYALMHQASALVSTSSGAYCFVEALAADSPADLFLWNLYTGASLPNSTTPSCSPCSKDLLDMYATQAANGTLALSRSYDEAVKMTNAKCGTNWAQTVLVAQSSSAYPTLSLFSSLPSFTLGPLLSFFLSVALLFC